MKKALCILISMTLLVAMTACGGAKEAETKAPAATEAETAAETQTTGEWSRDGYFTDKDGNFLSISYSDEENATGWYIGCMLDDESHGNMLKAEGNTLHGNIIPEYEEGECIVTISEEGENGLMLEVEGGKTYHFTETEMEKAAISVYVHVEGIGHFSYAEEGTEPDRSKSYTSVQIALQNPASYVFAAEPEEGYTFVKWTLNGEDYSTEAEISAELTEDAEYTAVFEQE